MTVPLPTFVGLDMAAAARHANDQLALLDDIAGAAVPDDAMAARLRDFPGGPYGALGLVLLGVPPSFLPGEADGETGTAQFDLDMLDGTRYRMSLEFRLDECRVGGPVDDPSVTVVLSLAVFLRIAFKYLDGNDAYLDGLTEVAGDVFLATRLDQWFDAPIREVAEAVERDLTTEPSR
jgi:hypothetical protein